MLPSSIEHFGKLPFPKPITFMAHNYTISSGSWMRGLQKVQRYVFKNGH